MLSRFKPPGKGFVDIVTWLVTALSGFGLAILVLQSPFVWLADSAKEMRNYWLLALVQFVVLSAIGLGLRSRRSWARIAFITVLLVTILWQLYWLVAIATRQVLPLVPDSFVTSDLFRLPAAAMSVFWSVVYGWLVYRFLRPDVASQFERSEA